MNRKIEVFNFYISPQNANDAVDIYIDGGIVDAETQQILKDWYGDETSVSFKSFRNQLQAKEAKTFNIYINSYGGLVTDAMAIHDLIAEMRSKGKLVNTVGMGIIASSATYILMAGNSSMSKNSWFMIHNVAGGVYGDVNMVEQYAAMLRKFNNSSRDFYANATGKRKEDITKMMDAETWLTAEEAQQHGFISNVTGEAKFTNSIPRDVWQYSNMAVLNAYNSAVAGPAAQNTIQNQIDDMKKFFQDFGTQILNAIKGVKAPAENDHSALMQSIGEAVGNQFATIGEQMETAVNDAVATAVSNAVADAVSAAVEAAVLPLNEKITELEKAKEDLENDIVEMKGKQTQSTQDDAPAPIGSFGKK